MRATTLTGVGEIEVQERERPEPKDDEVLVEVGACSVCMTDYHMYHGTFTAPTPLVLGHESSGTVAEVGADVDTVAVGDRVAINPTVPCNACSYCKRGETHLCENNTSIGGAGETILDGAFAEYVRVPAINVEDIGEMSFERAALAEPLACCIHGVEQVDLTPGDSVAIVGAGPIGLLLLQSFRNAGASPIVVSELDDERRELASELGADVVVDPDEVDPEVAIPEAAGGKVDVGAEAIGLVPTIKQANAVTAKGGSTLVFGVPDQEATMEVSPFDIFFDEVGYRGSFSLTTEDFERAVTMLRYGRIDADALITERIGLDDLPTAFERMENAEGLKKVVVPDTDG
ncbi:MULTISPECIES: alcohol dehydrogenase catalytic domain-containing protein [Haloarcula]|uniref:Alcohol dehydrogenase n=1 Tax=Haloarcula pellucida TaxID=1427151 RepID=A0A830GTA3_9EURY|nr:MULTISPECIES: alcohol dehydrogenase catalytic domain-containing protein [Halomicroarcula]MBX0350199.1 alcohol dehydrogenase catalytic domain-containing protein [Halomicroarcula pellucida]MDS0277699.1 alcohol dehydrogenase catalytic domain-containing protein [Halomicroarcula sp. S1AR25-4]GGO00861.1 alcohol dehydrogenase [Halomicroarcula pellucida]